MALNKDTIIDIIRPLIDEAENFQSDLGDVREELYQRYRAEDYGNETEGWSTSVDPIIWDCIQGLIPGLMATYTDNWYELSGPSTERCTAFKELINYQLYRKQESYSEIQAFITDSLLYQYAVAKVTYVETYHDEMQKFESLTADDMSLAFDNEMVTVSKWDEIEEDDPITGGTLKRYENVKMVKKVPDYKGPLFECIPPWEFGFTPGYKTIDECPLVYHKVKRSLSYIKQKELDGEYLEGSYALCRDQLTQYPMSDEEESYVDTQTDADSSLSETDTGEMAAEELIPAIEVDIYECYVKIDVDEDGLLEDQIITICGDVVLKMDDNPYRRPPFRIGVSYPESHKITGVPLASILEEDQKVMTNLKRMAQDAAAQSVYTNPITDDANLYKLLLNRKPHDPLLGNPQRMGKLEVNPPHEFVLKTIEMIQGDIENKSGVTRYNQGTDADSLNKTATGIRTIATMAQQRARHVGRNIGNMAMKGIIRDFIFINQKWPPEEALKVIGAEYPISPEDLRGEYDISIEIGVGPQEKQMASQMVDQLLQFQLQVGLKMGLATPDTIYKTLMKKYDYLDIDIDELVINPNEQVNNGQSGTVAGGAGAGQPSQPTPQGNGIPQHPQSGGGPVPRAGSPIGP